MARGVDLRRHPTTVRGIADEFVPEHATESHIAPGQLQVGVADPYRPDPKDGLSGAGLGFGEVVAETDARALAGDASHRVSRPFRES
jgi:hypothetical protein